MERDQKRWQAWVVCAVIAAVTFGLYASVLHDDFITFDDHAYVVDNTHVQNGVTFSSVVWAFTTGRASNWHPLTWISHMVDWQLYGLKNPGGHHFTNLLFHIANSLLLFLVLRRMTGTIWRSAIVAALFAWHPLHVESVAWIAERKDVLSAFFWLLTMLAYAIYVEKSKVQSPKSKVFYSLTLFFFILGLLSKPMVVTLPFVLLLMDFWPLKRISNGKYFQMPESVFPLPKGEGRGEEERDVPAQAISNIPAATLPQLIREKIPFFLLAAISSLVTFLVQRAGGAVMSTENIPIAPRICTALVGYAAYLEKTFWPSGLAIFYPRPLHWQVSQVLGAVVILLIISAIVIRLGRSRPWLMIGWLWYLGTLVPVIGLVQVGSQFMADRYSYLPLIGIFIIVVWAVAEAFGKGRPDLPVGAWGVFAPVLILCLLLTRTQLGYWKNSEILFHRDLAVTMDSAIAHFNLARALDESGHATEAAAEFNAALKANPDAPIALLGMGRFYSEQGDSTNALKYYLAALKADPNYGDAHFNLANLLTREGQFPEAAEHFTAALRSDPDAADAHNNLGAVLMRLGRADDAMAQFREALRINPNYPEAQDQLGSLLLNGGHTREAKVHFAEAVRLKPDFVHARIKLGLVLAQDGDLTAAISQFKAALKLEPENMEATFDLAAADAAAGELDEAAQIFAMIAQNHPTDVDVRIRLGAILTGMGKFEPAISVYREALLLKPDSVEVLKGLAWVLATAPKPELRNGAEAVSLAEQAAVLTDHKQPAVLAALDAAYAEAGRFDDAIKTAVEVQKLALAENRADQADNAAKRIELYRAGKSFHY